MRVSQCMQHLHATVSPHCHYLYETPRRMQHGILHSRHHRTESVHTCMTSTPPQWILTMETRRFALRLDSVVNRQPASAPNQSLPNCLAKSRPPPYTQSMASGPGPGQCAHPLEALRPCPPSPLLLPRTASATQVLDGHTRLHPSPRRIPREAPGHPRMVQLGTTS